jgi:serine/threonine-protein kinase MRCK
MQFSIFVVFQNTSQVIIYEITRMKARHKRLREVLLPAQAQCLDIFSDSRLCIGYQSGFTIYSLMGDQHPQCEYFLEQNHS